MKKHIVIICWGFPELNSKGNPFIKDTALGLIKHGYDISVLDFEIYGWKKVVKQGFNKSTDFNEVEGIKRYKIFIFNPLVSTLFPKKFIKKLLQIQTLKKFKKWASRVPKVSCIQQHFILHSYPFIIDNIAKKLNIPYTIFEHAPIHNENQLARKITTCTNDYITKSELLDFVKNAKFRVSKSKLWSKKYEQILNADFHVINGFIDEKIITLPKAERLSTSEIRLINVGTINENKGSLILLDAVKLIEEYNIHLLYCGGGPFEQKLQEMCSELPKNIRVTITGFVNRESVIKNIDQSDFLIIASESETFGNTAIEALGRGIPVLSTRCGGPEEIVQEFCGGFFSDRSPKGIMQGIISGIKRKEEFDPDLIISYYNEKFSEEVICKQINDLYNTLVWTY